MSEIVIEEEEEDGGEALPGGARHRAREVALQVLYAIDLGSRSNRPPLPPRAPARRREPGVAPAGPAAMDLGSPMEDTRGASEEEVGAAEGLPAAMPQEVFDRVMESFPVPRSALIFANNLVSEVCARAPEIDALLGEHARNWRVSRMAAVDRNVLRLAAYELRDTDTPVAVIIDEAVDLARRFGSDTSPPFVNGVLDSLARNVRTG